MSSVGVSIDGAGADDGVLLDRPGDPDMDIRVRKPDGWTTVSFPDDVEQVTIATGKADGHLSFTLIGTRSSVPNEVVTDVLDVDPEDEAKIASEVPRTDDGTSLPLDQLRPG